MEQVNRSDQAYFGKFVDGYSAYSAGDLDIVVGALAALIRDRWNRATEGLRFIEIGCASGQFSTELSARLLDHVALDYFGLDIALPVLAKYPFNKVCGTAFSMPLPAQSMDVICFPASLHHLWPFEAALAEMERVLKPGGLMFCIEPNFYHPHRRWFMRFQTLYRLYRDANDVPIRADWLERFVGGLGLRVIESRYINLQFRQPGSLQRIQNRVAELGWPDRWRRWVMPWFIFAAEKRRE